MTLAVRELGFGFGCARYQSRPASFQTESQSGWPEMFQDWSPVISGVTVTEPNPPSSASEMEVEETAATSPVPFIAEKAAERFPDVAVT